MMRIMRPLRKSRLRGGRSGVIVDKSKRGSGTLRGHVFQTPMGWCAVVTRRGRVVRVIPGARSREEAVAEAEGAGDVAVTGAASPYCDAAGRAGWFELKAERVIRAYLAGERRDVPLAADLTAASDFQRRVYDECRLIPPGQTRSYGWLAGQVADRRYARAVAGALASNPVPLIVPCHRVIRSDGGLGGFSACGGTSLKLALLELERK